jgi:DNA polymerase III alpha subunit (gram-positive type)
MVEAAHYLGPDAAQKVVVDNTVAIADMVESLSPVPMALFSLT